MSEYISIEAEPTDHKDVMLLLTNVMLSLEAEPEVYDTPDDGSEGSPLAQALFEIPGLMALTLEGKDLMITRQEDVEWHDLVEDVSDVLRDFFL